MTERTEEQNKIHSDKMPSSSNLMEALKKAGLPEGVEVFTMDEFLDEVTGVFEKKSEENSNAKNS